MALDRPHQPLNDAIERLREIETECRETVADYCDDAEPATVQHLRAEMHACARGADALTLVRLLVALEWNTAREAEQRLIDLRTAARRLATSPATSGTVAGAVSGIMKFIEEDAVKALADARVTLGIGYGQDVSLACLALINRLRELGEPNPAALARAAVRHQSGVSA